jgi:hypothetical protein
MLFTDTSSEKKVYRGLKFNKVISIFLFKNVKFILPFVKITLHLLQQNFNLMNSITLFSNKLKNVGWLIFIPSIILGLILISGKINFNDIKLPVFYYSGFPFDNGEAGFFRETEINLFSNLIGILIIIGGVMVGFSKEKIEDEYISSLRLRSMFWSLAVTYTIVLILFLTLFGAIFFTVMIVIIFMPLILYVFRFNYLLLKK